MDSRLNRVPGDPSRTSSCENIVVFAPAISVRIAAELTIAPVLPAPANACVQTIIRWINNPVTAMTIYQLHSEPLREKWLDVYGHLNEAYYLAPFSNTTWKLQHQFGIGEAYFDQTGCALYTVETHLRYLKDVRQPAEMVIESMVLGSDAKRIWFAHQMLVDGSVRATAEFMTLHYDTRLGKTSSMSEEVQQQLKQAEITEKPEWVQGQIGFRKR